MSWITEAYHKTCEKKNPYTFEIQENKELIAIELGNNQSKLFLYLDNGKNIKNRHRPTW